MAHSCFFLDTQNPNPNPERKMRDVLCIFCYRRVFILNMDLILSDEDFKKGTSPKRPPMKRILDFEESGLPLGMGLLKSGNFLYMFGGEYTSDHLSYCTPASEESKSDRRPVYGAGIPKENPPCPVFRLDLTNDYSAPIPLCSMLGPKIYPFVAEVGGQIYVLSKIALSSILPMFEVWNPMTQDWRVLPNPPPFSEGWNIIYHCVCGEDIVCVMECFFLYRFNTFSESWECLANLSSREEMAMLRMMGRFDVGSDVYIQACGDSLWAFMNGHEGEDGYSAEVDSDKTRPQVPGFVIVDETTLADTSEQGEFMCGLIPYFDFDAEGYLLYVFVFQIEKLESEKVSPSQARLSVRHLRSQVYDFTFLECKNEEFHMFCISRAIIGRLLHNTSTES